MRIAVASGKGGTGKTTVSVSLALALSTLAEVTLVDCDVEEPNAGIFLKLEELESGRVSVPAYECDEDECIACGKCAKACRFNAIAALKTKPIFFPELCHGCGGCVLACPANAIKESSRKIGSISHFRHTAPEYQNLSFTQGLLDVGEAMATPLIRNLLGADSIEGEEEAITIIDAPPGTNCSMIATVSACDYVLLVTEPTVFGLNDLKLAVEAVRMLGKPFMVILNRAVMGNTLIDDYCRSEGIELALIIAESRSVAQGYSRGEPLLAQMPHMQEEFCKLYGKISGGYGRV